MEWGCNITKIPNIIMKTKILLWLLAIIPTVSLAQNSDRDKMSLDPNDKFHQYLDGYGQRDDSTHNYAAYKKNGVMAIVDLKTKKATTQYKYSWLGGLNHDRISAALPNFEGNYILDMKGNAIFGPFYGEATTFAFSGVDSLFYNHASVIINFYNYPMRYNNFLTPDYAKYGLIDIDGKPLTDFDYTYIDRIVPLLGVGRFSKSEFVKRKAYHLNPLKRSGKWGLMRADGKIVVPDDTYNYITFGTEGDGDPYYFRVFKGRKRGLIDHTGKVIIEPTRSKKEYKEQYEKLFNETYSTTRWRTHL